MTRRARSRSPFSSRALSITISVWIQTSPSGCHSGSCSQPTSGRSSGSTRSDDAEVEREREADRRPLACSSSFSNLAQIRSAGRSSRGNADTDSPCAPRGETRIARRTARRAARAGCRRRSVEVDGAQQPPRQIAAAVERILILVRQRIPRDRVDREVAPPRHRRSDIDGSPSTVEALMAAPRPWIRGVAARRRSRSPLPRTHHLVDRKALAHRLARGRAVPAAQADPPADAEDLDVDVLRGFAAQAIANPAADDQRPAASGVRGTRDIESEWGRRNRRSHRNNAGIAEFRMQTVRDVG